MTYLVTGADGFLGRWVLRELKAQGADVRGFDLPRVERHDSNDYAKDTVRGDLRDPTAAQSAVDGCDLIIHLAYKMDIYGDDTQAAVAVNIVGFGNVLEAALDAGVRRVVWASSVMVYGPPIGYAPGPVDEDAVPCPSTFYGSCKVFNEAQARRYRERGLETVALRFATIFGPGRTRRGAAPFAVDLFENASRGMATQLDDGDRRLDMIYASDAARACVLAARNPASLSAVYNVPGFLTSLRELGAAVSTASGVTVTVAPGGSEPWPADLSGEAARLDLGYAPKLDLNAAVRHYLGALA